MAIASSVLAISLMRPAVVIDHADVAQATSVARNLMDGHGLTTSIVFYEEHHDYGRLPVPQTVFPPGLPIVISVFASCGLALLASAKLVAMLGLLGSLWITYYLAKNSSAGADSALLPPLVWLTFVMVWASAISGMSEATFTCLTLAATWLLAGAKGRTGTGFLAAAGIVAAAAFAVRYAGLFYVVSALIVIVFTAVRDSGWRRAAVESVSFATPPAVIIATIVARNAWVAEARGDFVASPDIHEGFGPFRAGFELLNWGKELAGFALKDLWELRVPEVGAVACLVLAVAVLLNRRLVRFDRQAGRAALANVVNLHSIVYVVVSVAALMLLLLTSGNRELEQPRFLIPLVPFASIVLVAAWGCLGGRGRSGRIALRLAAIALLAAYGLGQAANIEVARERAGPGNAYWLIRAAVDSVAVTPAGPGLLEAESPLLVEPGQSAGLVLDRPIVALPHSKYSSETWDAPAVRAVVERYGIEHIVLFVKVVRPGGRYRTNQPFMDDLLAGRMPPWVSPVLVTDEIMMFEVSTPDEHGHGDE